MNQVGTSHKKAFRMRGGYRDKTLDILRGLGIILVVLGHSGFPFTHFIYLFHMAIFFMASGYMWDDKNVISTGSCKRYILRKTKTLWIPFTLTNGIFNLLNNLLIKIGFYTDNAEFLTLSISRKDMLTSYMSIKEIAIAVFKNICLSGGSQLGGATWFLRTLFLISIGHMVLRYFYRHFRIGKAIFWICAAVAVILTQMQNSLQLELTLGVHNCFAAYVVFLMGMFLKQYDIMNKIKKHMVVVWGGSVAVLIVMNFLGKIAMDTGYITNIIYFVIVSIAGWLMMYGVALALRCLKLADGLAYLGKHTLWILLLHFLSFKVVSLIYILVNRENILYLASFPVVQIAEGGWWLAYTLVGIFIPLVAEWIIKLGVKNIQVKVENINVKMNAL